MQEALRNRLTYGPLMLLGMLAVLYLDYRIEGWTHGWVTSALPVGTYGVAGVGLLFLLLITVPIATTELTVLFTAEHVAPYRDISIIGSTLIGLHGFLTQFAWFQNIAASSLMFIVVFVMLLAALRRASERQTQQAITRMAGTVLSVLYLGGLGWFLIALRVKHSMNSLNGFQGSTQAVVMILLVVKSTDIGAFFGGRKYGKRKLIPWLSPGKTWEGLGFGLATSGLVGLGCAILWHKSALNTSHWFKAAVFGLIFGVVIGFIGQLGDLLESLFKRDAEVKDSGKLIPGFGGILDVIDSPLLAAPFAYLLFSISGNFL